MAYLSIYKALMHMICFSRASYAPLHGILPEKALPVRPERHFPRPRLNDDDNSYERQTLKPHATRRWK